MLPRARVALLFVFPLLGACQAMDPGFACTAVAVVGLQITVRDSLSGQLLRDSLRVRATDGGYAEELLPGGVVDSVVNGTLLFRDWIGAYERAGRYTVTVQRPGYLTTAVGALVVTRDQCHVQTVTATIRLTPGP